MYTPHLYLLISAGPSPEVWVEFGPLSLYCLHFVKGRIHQAETCDIDTPVLEVIQIQLIHHLQQIVHNIRLDPDKDHPSFGTNK